LQAVRISAGDSGRYNNGGFAGFCLAHFIELGGDVDAGGKEAGESLTIFSADLGM